MSLILINRICMKPQNVLYLRNYSVLLNNFATCTYCRNITLKADRPNHFERDETVKKKVIFNSKIKHGRSFDYKNELESLNQELYCEYKSKGPPIIAVKYLNKDENITTDFSDRCESEDKEEFNFPYRKYHHVTINDRSDCNSSTGSSNCESDYYSDNINSRKESPGDQIIEKSTLSKSVKNKLIRGYNKYVEVSVKHQEAENEDDNSSHCKYGTADPKVAASTTPCGGCGAHLHCKDAAVPGFLPKEVFVGRSQEQLQALVCQRCHFLREYDVALSVTVDPEVYPRLLSRIKSEKALVILVVDMTDFPCSIWPGIVDIIGPKRPLFVVGNKIDLLQDASLDWMSKAKESLISQVPRRANLLHTALVSAKTGYGIEKLITALYKLWEYRGDVYLVGCTNVGKSTLFNALLQSDYCKNKASELLQRATTAPWPGTTLNLLKFPILRPEGWRMAMRGHRLREQNSVELNLVQETRPEHILVSDIKRTFTHGNTNKFTDDYWDDPFAMPKLSTLKKLRMPGSGLHPQDTAFEQSRWLYDTPGVLTSEQIIDLLTTEELVQTLPRRPLVPRTFQLWPGQAALIAGLARLDYVSGQANIKITVLAAATLPVTLCWARDAAEVYEHYLGGPALTVPCGSERRLRHWPGLSPGQPFVLRGVSWKESCADIVLSSAGWIAVTAGQDVMCELQAHTPHARGIHVRTPPVLPHAIRLKGARMFRSQAYTLLNRFAKEHKLIF